MKPISFSLALFGALLMNHAANAATSGSTTPLDQNMQTLGGDEVNPAEKYDGKVVLLVNVASRCGLTPQYEALQGLHQKYAERGLAVVGVPCNQFNGQEPGTADEIAEFCTTKYGVEFDLLEKTEVNGENEENIIEGVCPGRDTKATSEEEYAEGDTGEETKYE